MHRQKGMISIFLIRSMSCMLTSGGFCIWPLHSTHPTQSEALDTAESCSCAAEEQTELNTR